ncbi:hypothetical protein [Ehrlichia canis]|uniref:Uncharacterized protein n=1 Tax=Ehrlichia canis (strain Jake) TaxID=269484 RepID=A0ACA6AY35_EHRCJ|nr:hypothetical protein [Ehrlichia canis]AAZ68784.1 hypothetical protein Ecaj_0752 [Ehrlichia canis str. Jake]AUO54488.1 hypothetical protein C1I72_01035 [Ehrlichia canis]UKC53409.1 hypothetical protein s20019040002_000452 [Ehrlichia canis]UKC54345.1 hypothetical protein s20026770001_000451 [Ehrlichia canis]UKC55281.1 hypothetical protein s21009500007_000451 [Ehrlichia canis]
MILIDDKIFAMYSKVVVISLVAIVLTLLFVIAVYKFFQMFFFDRQLKKAYDFVHQEVKEGMNKKLIGIHSTGDRCLYKITNTINYIMEQFEALDKCVAIEGNQEKFYRGMIVARMIGAYRSREQLSEYEKSLLRKLKSEYAEDLPIDIRAEAFWYIRDFVNGVCADIRDKSFVHFKLKPELFILGRMKVALEILENCMRSLRKDITLEHFFYIMRELSDEQLIETVTSKDPQFMLMLSQSVKEKEDVSNNRISETCFTSSDIIGFNENYVKAA